MKIPSGRVKVRWVIISLIAMVVIVLMSPLFGYAFEPLDVVSENLRMSETSIYVGPMPDYTVPRIRGDVSGIFAGIMGTFATLIAGIVVGYALVKGKG